MATAEGVSRSPAVGGGEFCGGGGGADVVAAGTAASVGASLFAFFFFSFFSFGSGFGTMIISSVSSSRMKYCPVASSNCT